MSADPRPASKQVAAAISGRICVHLDLEQGSSTSSTSCHSNQGNGLADTDANSFSFHLLRSHPHLT